MEVRHHEKHKHKQKKNTKNMTFNIVIEQNGISGCGSYDAPSETLGVKKFDTKKEAKKELARMIKEDGYQRHYHYVFNTELATKALTNF